MERALLVNVRWRQRAYRDPWPAEESAQELRELARSGGTQVLEERSLQQERPIPAYLIGKGQAEQIHERCDSLKPDAVIFGQDLSSSQQRNLEEVLGVKVIDRTQLILDIFAQRAHSQEGKVQVELAQLEYLFPRLAGKGILLSRLGGGIGTRGPGEQKLEMDRRRIRARIARLRGQLQEIGRRRGVARAKREEEQVPAVSLIGYTNAGKSTLLNALTQAGAVAEDRLFSTLDPLTRRLALPNGQGILLTDTVGFLHRLPHHLVEAFRGTLEEVTQSALLLHVADGSIPLLEERMEAVSEVLRLLEAESKPVLLVLNKKDRMGPGVRESLRRKYPESVAVSALTGEGLGELTDRLAAALGHLLREVRIRISGKDLSWIDEIYRSGQILKRWDRDVGVELLARVPSRLYGQLRKAGLVRE